MLLIGIASMSLPSCGVADKELFTQSVESMEKVARTVEPSDRMKENPQEIGKFVFDDVYRNGDLVFFKVGDTADTDPYGYVWSPKGKPVDDPNDAAASSFEHIQGHWYRWSDSY
jgi:hypothetical protein